MSARVSLKRPSRRGVFQDSNSRGKEVLDLDEHVDFSASPGIIPRQDSPGLAASAIPQSNQPVGLQASALPPIVPIDVDAIEDDVELLLSSRAFPQGNQIRRNHPVTVVLDKDLDVQIGPSGISANKREIPVTVNKNRVMRPTRQSSVNFELHENYENLECSHRHKRKCAVDGSEQPQMPQKDRGFTCAICWGNMTEEASTTCGHIFCHTCIKTAIQTQKKCPACRKTLTLRNIHRVYLPTAQ